MLGFSPETIYILLAGMAGSLFGAAFSYWLQKRRDGGDPTLMIEALLQGDADLAVKTCSANDKREQLLRKYLARQEEGKLELDRAKHDLLVILEALDIGVLTADHRCNISRVNPAMVQLFGLRGNPVGRSVLSTLRLPLVQTMLMGVLQDQEAQQDEVELPGSPEPTFVILSAAPLRDATGQPGAIVLARDVSRLRRLESMRKEFVSNVSHELRTPLSIFHGHLETLIETPDLNGSESRDSLQTMRRHSLRLNALVEDLLTLARLESGRDLLQKEAMDVLDFLEEICGDWGRKVGSKQIKIGLSVQQALPAIVADAFKLRQVFDNLLDNAVKHSPAGSEVFIRAKCSGEPSAPSAVEISVTDSGVGIARESLPHIFERFYRADRARSRELGGTGLGLAIVKHIVQVHGGWVKATSELGQGTEVTVTLPIVACET